MGRTIEPRGPEAEPGSHAPLHRRMDYRIGLVGLAALLCSLRTAEAQPFRVCAFVFNTPDELATIRANLPPPDFEVIDLTPAHASVAEDARDPAPVDGDDVMPARAEGSGWLMRSCRADLLP